jgi:hypothetical protein
MEEGNFQFKRETRDKRGAGVYSFASPHRGEGRVRGKQNPKASLAKRAKYAKKSFKGCRIEKKRNVTLSETKSLAGYDDELKTKNVPRRDAETQRRALTVLNF